MEEKASQPKAKTTKRHAAHVSKEKINAVKEMVDLIKNKRTILIASIKNLPSAKFQDICKRLREKAIVKVPKKNLILKAIDSSKDEELAKVEEQIKDSVAILFSDMDSFELSIELIKNKSATKAKTGQEAPEDIEVQAGPTELIPGPAIAELGSLGIPIQIEKGKIHIRESKVIVKKGQKITANAADVMAKLDIKPFSVGFVPLCAFDTKENKLYLEIKIDREGTLNELKASYAKALPFAIEIGYTTPETIRFIIGKAGREEKAMENIVNSHQNKSEEEK